jgi:hypothetical protein
MENHGICNGNHYGYSLSVYIQADIREVESHMDALRDIQLYRLSTDCYDERLLISYVRFNQRYPITNAAELVTCELSEKKERIA